MKEKLFAVYDQKAKVYLPVFQARTVGAAERSFQDAVNAKDHHFSQHPEDFVLVELGDIDLETGVIEPDVPRNVVRADQVIYGTQDQGVTPEYPSESIQ